MYTGDRKVIYAIAVTGFLAIGTYMVIQYRKLIKSLERGFSTVAGAVIQELNMKRIKMTLLFQINNDSDISFTVKNQVYDIFINGVFVSKITNNEALNIKSNSSTMFPLDVNIKADKLLNIGPDVLLASLGSKASKKDINFEIKGKLSLSAGRFINVKDYTFTQSFALKDLLDKSK